MSLSDPVLIIGDDPHYCETLASLVSRYGLTPICCPTLGEANALMDQQAFCAVLCKEILPDGHFAMLIREPGGHMETAPIIVVSHRDDWDSFLAVIGIGAFDVVHFPPKTGELEQSLWFALNETRWSKKKAA